MNAASTVPVEAGWVVNAIWLAPAAAGVTPEIVKGVPVETRAPNEVSAAVMVKLATAASQRVTGIAADPDATVTAPAL